MIFKIVSDQKKFSSACCVFAIFDQTLVCKIYGANFNRYDYIIPFFSASVGGIITAEIYKIILGSRFPPFLFPVFFMGCFTPGMIGCWSVIYVKFYRFIFLPVVFFFLNFW